MAALLIGYARCCTDQQDLTAQHDGLTALGVSPARIRRSRPDRHHPRPARPAGGNGGLPRRRGEQLDRLARSLPDARAIADELTARQVRLRLGASVHDPNDPVGRLLFNVLAMVAEFESDLIRLRTREGMKVAKANARLRGKRPKLNPRQEAHLVGLLQPVSTAPPNWPTCSVSLAPPSTAPSNATRQPPDRTTADAVPQKHQCRAPTVQRPQHHHAGRKPFDLQKLRCVACRVLGSSRMWSVPGSWSGMMSPEPASAVRISAWAPSSARA
jgi:hypothetical protein